MAISLRGTPTLSSVVASGNVTISLPTGATTGDYLLVWIAYRDSAAFSPPAGGYWTQLQVSNTGDLDSTAGVGSGVLYGGYYNASMGTVFTRTGGDRAQGLCIALQGVASSGALESSTITTNTGTSLSVAGGTPTTDGSWIWAFFSGGDNVTVSSWASSNGTPSSFTQVDGANDNTGVDGSLQSAYGSQATAAAVGNITASASGGGTHVLARVIVKPPLSPVTTSPGSGLVQFTSTGTAPTLLHAKKVAYPDRALVQIVSTEPTVRRGEARPVAVGLVRAEGVAPTVSRGTTIPVASGEVRLTGSAPARADKIAPSCGTATWLGLAASLAFSVAVGAGSATVVGAAPTLSIASAGVAVPVASGALTLAGGYVRRGVPGPNTGAVVIAGAAPTVQQTKPVPVAAGSAQFTGASPSLAAKVDIPSGAVTLTGAAPEALATGARVVPSGALQFAGQLLARAWPGPDTAAIVLVGAAPTVSIQSATVSRTPDAGALQFTGASPSLRHGVAVGAGALVAVGAAPSRKETRSVASGVAVFVGASPNMGAAGTCYPSVGAVVVVGAAPSLHHVRTVASGLATFAGASPARIERVTRLVGSGALVIEGAAPTMPAAGSRYPGVGVVTFLGAAPSLRYVRRVEPGTLTFVGGGSSLVSRRPVGAGAVVTVASAPSLRFIRVPSAGSITVVGAAPTRRVGLGRVVAAGSVTLAGVLPTLAITRRVPTGAVTFAGSAPVPLAQGALSPSSGSLRLDGQSVLAVQKVRITIASGAIVLAPASPSIRRFANPPVGLVRAIGSAPAARIAYRAGAGSIVVVGHAPQVVSRRVVPAGTCRTVGAALALRTGRPVASAAVVFAGYAPRLARKVLVPGSTLRLTGQAPTRSLYKLCQPTSGAVQFVGSAPVRKVRIVPPTGAVVVSGASPNVGASIRLSVPVGTVRAIGAAPMRDSGRRPGSAVLRFTGASTTQHIGIGIASGEIRIVGYPPSQMAGVASGVIVIVGHAPTRRIISTWASADVAQHLQQSGVGQVGTDIFIGYLPPSPVRAIAAIDRSGWASADRSFNGVVFEHATVGVLVRAASYAAAETLINSVCAACMASNVTINGTWYGRLRPVSAPYWVSDDGLTTILGIDLEAVKSLSRVA